MGGAGVGVEDEDDMLDTISRISAGKGVGLSSRDRFRLQPWIGRGRAGQTRDDKGLPPPMSPTPVAVEP